MRLGWDGLGDVAEYPCREGLRTDRPHPASLHHAGNQWRPTLPTSCSWHRSSSVASGTWAAASSSPSRKTRSAHRVAWVPRPSWASGFMAGGPGSQGDDPRQRARRPGGDGERPREHCSARPESRRRAMRASSRTVSRGSSRSSVLPPTRMASLAARKLSTRALSAAPEMRAPRRSTVSILPSAVMAMFTRTRGRLTYIAYLPHPLPDSASRDVARERCSNEKGPAPRRTRTVSDQVRLHVTQRECRRGQCDASLASSRGLANKRRGPPLFGTGLFC